MKRLCGVLSGLLVIPVIAVGAGLASPIAPQSPTFIVDKARAIPTQSGDHVRVTVYTKRVKRVKVSVDGGRRLKGRPFGRGCDNKCAKWKVYAPRRSDDDCYDLEVTARYDGSSVLRELNVCEPFPDGQL